MRRPLRHLLLVISILTLWSCAHKPPPLNLPPGWVVQKEALQDFQTWTLRGKFAYKQDEEAFSSSILWQEQSQRTDLKLLNTLGITLLDMQVTPSFTQIEVDGNTYRDRNPQQLLLDITGWNIPVDELRLWIKGLPSSNDAAEFNENGTIRKLQPNCTDCQNWVVDYNRYMEHNGLVLPQSLTISDKSKPNSFIKLRISKWQ